jgi:hypothetical protein
MIANLEESCNEEGLESDTGRRVQEKEIDFLTLGGIGQKTGIRTHYLLRLSLTVEQLPFSFRRRF